VAISDNSTIEMKGEKGVMEIIDTHHHLWDLKENYYPWLTDKIRQDTFFGEYAAIRNNYLITDYLSDISNQNVVKSVHVQAGHDPSDPVRETRWVQSIADNPNSRGFPHAIVAFADFSAPNIQQVLEGHCQYPNLRGIRQAVHNRSDLLKNPTWLRNLGLLGRYGLSFELEVFYHQMGDAACVVQDHSDITFILCHTGLPAERTDAGLDGWRRGMRTLAVCPNIGVKISGLGQFDRQWTIGSIRPFVLWAIDIFGVDRCFFGSNFPVDKMMSTYDVLWNAFKEITAAFPEGDCRKLFHDNAARYYRL
jgi:predicted TIM-barrel fold metal-dependent hydrolase